MATAKRERDRCLRFMTGMVSCLNSRVRVSEGVIQTWTFLKAIYRLYIFPNLKKIFYPQVHLLPHTKFHFNHRKLLVLIPPHKFVSIVRNIHAYRQISVMPLVDGEYFELP